MVTFYDSIKITSECQWLNENKYSRNVICIPSPNQSNILSAPCDSWWKALGSPVTASCHYRHSTRARSARTSAIREYALFNSASSKLPSTHIGLVESAAFLGIPPIHSPSVSSCFGYRHIAIRWGEDEALQCIRVTWMKNVSRVHITYSKCIGGDGKHSKIM